MSLLRYFYQETNEFWKNQANISATPLARYAAAAIPALYAAIRQEVKIDEEYFLPFQIEVSEGTPSSDGKLCVSKQTAITYLDLLREGKLPVRLAVLLAPYSDYFKRLSKGEKS